LFRILLFSQTISTFADCCEAAAAGTFWYVICFVAGAIMIAVPSLFYVGRRDSLKGRATSILFAASLILVKAIFLNAVPLLFFEPLLFFQLAQLPDCRAAIYPFGWRSCLIAMPQFVPLVSVISQLLCRNFSRGRRNQPIVALQFFMRPAQSLYCSAVIFKRLARSTDCRAAIF
jgi:hypothetical protein